MDLPAAESCGATLDTFDIGMDKPAILGNMNQMREQAAHQSRVGPSICSGRAHYPTPVQQSAIAGLRYFGPLPLLHSRKTLPSTTVDHLEYHQAGGVTPCQLEIITAPLSVDPPYPHNSV